MEQCRSNCIRRPWRNPSPPEDSTPSHSALLEPRSGFVFKIIPERERPFKQTRTKRIHGTQRDKAAGAAPQSQRRAGNQGVTLPGIYARRLKSIAARRAARAMWTTRGVFVIRVISVCCAPWNIRQGANADSWHRVCEITGTSSHRPRGSRPAPPRTPPPRSWMGRERALFSLRIYSAGCSCAPTSAAVIRLRPCMERDLACDLWHVFRAGSDLRWSSSSSENDLRPAEHSAERAGTEWITGAERLGTQDRFAWDSHNHVAAVAAIGQDATRTSAGSYAFPRKVGADIRAIPGTLFAIPVDDSRNFSRDPEAAQCRRSCLFTVKRESRYSRWAGGRFHTTFPYNCEINEMPALIKHFCCIFDGRSVRWTWLFWPCRIRGMSYLLRQILRVVEQN